MSFKFVEGNVWDKSYDVRINTVNCVGVMGKGVALEFKKHFPESFKQYESYCNVGLMRPGGLHFCFEHYKGERCLIINFATKQHWKYLSKLLWIQQGVDQLIEVFYKLPFGTTVAMPALGCGNGGLYWASVKDLLKKRLEYNTDNVKVEIYEPLALSQK